MKTWIPDEETYQTIQKLKTYVSFISNLEQATKTDKEKAQEIVFLIENINKPETHKQWNVCLDIYDLDIKYGFEEREGFYWRKWSLYFENGSLEIEAESYHTTDDFGHYGDDFNCYAIILFKIDEKEPRVHMSKSITEFIKDVQHYKNYITETLNEIEIDIDIW